MSVVEVESKIIPPLVMPTNDLKPGVCGAYTRYPAPRFGGMVPDPPPVEGQDISVTFPVVVFLTITLLFVVSMEIKPAVGLYHAPKLSP